jgi:hypothetical protein
MKSKTATKRKKPARPATQEQQEVQVVRLPSTSLNQETTSGLTLQHTPDNLIAMAIQSGNISIEVLERLSKLQQEWLDRQAKSIFRQALTDFQAEVPAIPKLKNVNYKTKANDTVDYNHAELDKMVTLIQPVKKKYNLSHEWKYEHFKDDKGVPMIKVICVVSHPSGHSESTSMEGEHDNSGGKNGIQGRGSTVTYLQRYTLKGAFGLVESGIDNDGGRQEEKKTEEKVKPTVAKPAMKTEQLNQAIVRINKGEDIIQECKNQFTLSKTQLEALESVDAQRKAKALQKMIDEQAKQ